MTSRPDLSIVVVSYNTQAMTDDCLRSVYEQAGDLALQVIVVDNDSRDGSVEMIKSRYPQVELIENNDNKGFAAANNQGFALCKADQVLLLNSDTLVLGDVLKESVAYLNQHEDVGAMGCRVLNSDRTLQRTCSGYPTLGRLLSMTLGLDRLPGRLAVDTYQLRSWARDSEREVDVISGCYLLVRKSIIDQVGGLDEQFFFFGEETDWCLRMRKAGWRLMFAPVGEIVHYGGGSVKKLNHRRDVMLTEATVRLHKKNGGLLAACGAFAILSLFNGSRALLWWLLSWKGAGAAERAQHFRRVVLDIGATWPRRSTE
ncbi:glycosyl transferase [Alkalilimnicola ehrlichii]|uniref:Glycosyl transferase n=1 Tax=Alkalilimnicola ehrlichii TaxID=351052 RepID=A0A3E0WWV0_9GAMM|nr:glycosyltransferase family 2 protein [Alkalilimnicola ehrlichii]RFA29345.1 glycosyl transferase [Alkalilimnicola ehrlichii]RFA36859.1 glycosyl transferase [Alkalilimnicola ehrlichii]